MAESTYVYTASASGAWIAARLRCERSPRPGGRQMLGSHTPARARCFAAPLWHAGTTEGSRQCSRF